MPTSTARNEADVSNTTLARRLRKLADAEGTDKLRERLGIGQSTLYYLLKGEPPKTRRVLQKLVAGGVQVPRDAAF